MRRRWRETHIPEWFLLLAHGAWARLECCRPRLKAIHLPESEKGANQVLLCLDWVARAPDVWALPDSFWLSACTAPGTEYTGPASVSLELCLHTPLLSHDLGTQDLGISGLMGSIQLPELMWLSWRSSPSADQGSCLEAGVIVTWTNQLGVSCECLRGPLGVDMGGKLSLRGIGDFGYLICILTFKF